MIEYPTKILLATDGGADSVRAGQVALALAAGHGAELHVVHVGHAASSTSGVTVEGGALPGERWLARSLRDSDSLMKS